MKERPILFSGPMVLALIEGRKTQTRRIVKGIHPDAGQFCYIGAGQGEWIQETFVGDRLGRLKCPYGKPGDRLWVRETFADILHGHKFIYRADSIKHESIRWTPSIFMPRAACRLLLEITDVRVERVQSISEKEAMREGVERAWTDGIDYFRPEPNTEKQVGPFGTHIVGFMAIWENLHGPASWGYNPWVWVIEFKKL